jgi:hypothetical protein
MASEKPLTPAWLPSNAECASCALDVVRSTELISPTLGCPGPVYATSTECKKLG